MDKHVRQCHIWCVNIKNIVAHRFESMLLRCPSLCLSCVSIQPWCYCSDDLSRILEEAWQQTKMAAVTWIGNKSRKMGKKNGSNCAADEIVFHPDGLKSLCSKTFRRAGNVVPQRSVFVKLNATLLLLHERHELRRAAMMLLTYGPWRFVTFTPVTVAFVFASTAVCTM